jgi:O-acetyl-ADP-ribose deacetylase (regulator of RNase III)
MTLVFKQGNILETKCIAIVNPVNTIGVMGKGVAKAIREKYPYCFPHYNEMCSRRLFKIGMILIAPPPSDADKYILMLPTKEDWHNPSKLDYVVKGLDKLVDVVEYHKITSLAVPALGCGEGGLYWDVVEPIMSDYLSRLHTTYVEVYEPWS